MTDESQVELRCGQMVRPPEPHLCRQALTPLQARFMDKYGRVPVLHATGAPYYGGGPCSGVAGLSGLCPDCVERSER